MNRGDVVIIGFPYTDLRQSKVRPALVVQNDDDNQRLRDSIFVLITGNTSRVNEATQLLVDPATSIGKSSGLLGPSAILCNYIHSIRQNQVIEVIGHLSDDLMSQVDDCLKAALVIS